MSNEKLLNILNNYMLHCGGNIWEVSMKSEVSQMDGGVSEASISEMKVYNRNQTWVALMAKYHIPLDLI
jgi:hypothetical protein